MNANTILETLAGPTGKFSYQIQPAETLAASLETYRGALNASGMGIGKTHMSLAAVLLSGRKAAVICPKPCVAGWERAFDHFCAKPLFIGGYEEMKAGSKYYTSSRGWSVPDDTVIIWDEPMKPLKAKKGQPKGNAAPIGSGPDGETCRTCKHARRIEFSKVYNKCALVKSTCGPGTDIRLKWAACSRWEAKQ